MSTMRFAAALVVLSVAVATLEMPARASEQIATANYVYETWYELERDMGPQFDRYFATLKEKAVEINGPERWVDAHHETNRRIVSLPASHVSDFRSDGYQETRLRKILGDEAYRELFERNREAQVSRRSYIRQYRADLSLNIALHSRDGIWATEYVLVTIEAGKEQQFERLWRKALAAYAKVSPHVVLTGTKTIVGDGPQYTVRRLLRTPADLKSLVPPSQAVETVFGSREAKAFAKGWSASVNKWETLVLDRTDLDARDATLKPRRAK